MTPTNPSSRFEQAMREALRHKSVFDEGGRYSLKDVEATITVAAQTMAQEASKARELAAYKLVKQVLEGELEFTHDDTYQANALEYLDDNIAALAQPTPEEENHG